MATFQLFFQSGRSKDLSAPLHLLQFPTRLIQLRLLYRHLRNCKLPLEENFTSWMVVASQTPSLSIFRSPTPLPPPCLLRTALRMFDPPTSVVSTLVPTAFFLRRAKLYGNRPLCLYPGTNMYGSTNFLPAPFVLIGSRSRGSWVMTGVASRFVSTRVITASLTVTGRSATHDRPHLKPCDLFRWSCDLGKDGWSPILSRLANKLPSWRLPESTST